jgi:hypothetical protein
MANRKPEIQENIMNNTYLDITHNEGKPGERRFALHMEEEELGLIADLLNSVNDLRAVPLRRTVVNTIRANDFFKLEIDSFIDICSECNGSGDFKLHDEFNQTVKKHTCPHCRGEGRRVCITTNRYEPLTPVWKDNLAPEKY